MRTPLFLIRFLKFEYWPWWIFYLPMAPVGLYHACRNRSLTFFTAVNPGIPLGGFIGESKSAILSKINKQYLPLTVKINSGNSFFNVLAQISSGKIFFPLIVKPDAGLRGKDVKKIYSEEELSDYHVNAKEDYLVQEYIDHEIELGILYSRLPDEEKGIVSSVTLKEFLSVTGDGCSSILKLMEKDSRSRFQIGRLKSELGEVLERVPLKDEKVLLEPIGNHCRGTKFISLNSIICNNLNQVFDQIAKPIDGFFYGRFDLKVKSIDDLLAGRTIRILEVNGAVSEPGHIYDPSYKLITAYKDLISHWNRVAAIAKENMRSTKPAKVSEVLKALSQR